MRALVQRVARASVSVQGSRVGAIGAGLCVFVGVGRRDSERDADSLAERLIHLRVFEDAAGRMNDSVLDKGGSVLIVSQFTLLADTRRGRRPSFVAAAPSELARPLVERLIEQARRQGLDVATGSFGAHMEIEIVADGPVTLMLDTQEPRSG